MLTTRSFSRLTTAAAFALSLQAGTAFAASIPVVYNIGNVGDVGTGDILRISDVPVGPTPQDGSTQTFELMFAGGVLLQVMGEI